MSLKHEVEQVANKLRRRIKIYQFAIIFLIAIFVPAFLIEKEIIQRNPYPLIDPLRNLVPQEDFIVNIQPLRDYLNNIVSSNKDIDISLYFEVLNTGANISINPQLPIFPASLAKLPLAMTVVKKVEDGKWDWSNELVLLENDVDENSGSLYQKPIGTRFTIEELVKELLTNSDNTAYKILVRNMDQSELFGIVQAIGLEELFTKEGKVSAKEYSRMFRALYTSSFLKRAHSSKILYLLTQTPFNDYLASGLPEGVKFAHKIGENEELGVYSDAGIVYVGDRAYLIAVMMHVEGGEQGRRKVMKVMKEVSQKSYEYIQTQ